MAVASAEAVAPDRLDLTLEPGATGRRILVPPGRWSADTAGPGGETVDRPAEITVEVSLESIPLLRRRS